MDKCKKCVDNTIAMFTIAEVTVIIYQCEVCKTVSVETQTENGEEE